MTTGPAMITPEQDGPAPLLRRAFALDRGHGAVTSAVLRVTALGVVEPSLNGRPVSAHLLTPGWSSYEWRIRVAEHDVAALLADENVLGLQLGNGWYRGRLGWNGRSAIYGTELGAWAELVVRFDDGHEQRVVTDSSWRSAPSATTADDLYDGQRIDARLRDDAWAASGFDAVGWAGVRVIDFDEARLTGYIGPLVSRRQEVAPERIWTSPAGATLVDFGQNLVGFVRVRVRGRAGDVVRIRHAEVLEHDELGVRPLRTARATDEYVLSGGDDEFEPTLTFHGFRYAEVAGWPGDIEDGALTAIVVGSELDAIGGFTCSDPLLNRLHENVVWGMRGNFVDVPTDCPQRDERLGWTGDIAVFAPTAAFLADVGPFLRDWLADVAVETADAGLVPFVVPDELKYETLPAEFGEQDATAIWGDAAVWVPDALHRAYGDPSVLADALPAAAVHLRRVATLLSADDVWDASFQFGDWLDPTAPPDQPWNAKAATGVVASASAYRSARMVEEWAAVLGLEAEQAEFAALADRLRAGFRAKYVRGGRLANDAATEYVLAIRFGLLDGDELAVAGDRLAALVEQGGHHVLTGFAGTPFICDALTETGHLDTAYRLLTERTSPSWLYPVTMGATTIWERWDSMLPDGSVNAGEMTSFNHYALGAVADWMHRVVGGIAPAEPGYRRIRVAPRPGGGLTSAEAALVTPAGPASVAWRIEDDGLHVDVLVPEGCEAELDLLGAPVRTLGPGRHRVAAP